MKRIYIASAGVCLALCAVSSYAQHSKVSAKSQKPSTSVAKQQSPRFLQVEATDDDFVTHKDLWNGYDYEAIAKAAKSTRDPKGDFETTDDYAARRQRAIEKPIYAGITLNSRIAIVSTAIHKKHNLRALGKDNSAGVGYTYDAETKKLEICASGEPFGSAQMGQSVESVITTNVKTSSYFAKNAFGARVNVSSVTGDWVTAAIPTGYRERCPIKMVIDATEAQDLLRTSGVVLLGHLRSPYFFETSAIYEKATVSSPYEYSISITRLLFDPEKIILLNRDTRQIIKSANW